VFHQLRHEVEAGIAQTTDEGGSQMAPCNTAIKNRLPSGAKAPP
jgi:hypothetical protein